MKYLLIFLVVVMGHLAYNTAAEALAEYRYRIRVEQCKSHINPKVPDWTEGITSWACKQWEK